MTKTELSEIVAKRMSIPKSRALAIVDALFLEMKESLMKEERIELRGFGSFTPRRVSPKKGRNPFSGSALMVSERLSVSFKPGKDLKDRIEESPS